jgi:hypothetical protein
MIEYLILVAGYVLTGLHPLTAIYLTFAAVHLLETRHHVKNGCDPAQAFYGCMITLLHLQVVMHYALAH